MVVILNILNISSYSKVSFIKVVLHIFFLSIKLPISLPIKTSFSDRFNVPSLFLVLNGKNKI